MKINPYKSKARYIAVSGVMLALAVALTTVESMFSAFLPLGMRIGLANIVVLTAALCINLPTAFLITILKSVFVFMTRGVTAGAMSVCGGLLAFAVTALLISRTKSSCVMISVISAVAHMGGQLCMAVLLTGSAFTFYYAPLLVVTAVGSGFVTGIASGVIIPQFRRVNGSNE